jgi:hypothetical protein
MDKAVNLKRALGAIAAAYALAACASASQHAAATGSILHYVRTGLDGAEAEHIYVFRPASDRLEVYKMRQRCTNAALVTADLDLSRREPSRMTGGRLRPDGSQEAFAFLTLEPETRRLSARVELPDHLIEESEVLGPAPLWLYDFDLAELSAAGLGDGPQTAVFSLALAWPDGGDEGFILNEGQAVLTPLGVERRRGRMTQHYQVGGAAFEGDQGGDLWVDRNTGAVVEARLGRPNHPGYNGLSLVLLDAESADASAWRARLLSHFEGC